MPHNFCATDFPTDLPCRLAFIGEAPGETEMEFGRPLIGPSGKVFNQILRMANIVRSEVLVTNVFNIQAPDNDPRKWTVSNAVAVEKGWASGNDCDGRYFEPGFIADHLARLSAEIDRARPKVLIPLGNTALWALTGRVSISSCRGSLMKATNIGKGLKVLPTFHPAYVMRQWKFFHTVVADVMKADACADKSMKELFTERNIWIRPTLKDLDFFWRDHLAEAKIISIDIETTRKWRQISCVGFGADQSHAICVPFIDYTKPSRSYWPTPEAESLAWSWVQKVCESDTPKLMQNGTYDAYWLWDRMGIKVRNYCEDTRLLHHALYPELPKDLGYMGANYAQEGPWKTMRSGQATKRED